VLSSNLSIGGKILFGFLDTPSLGDHIGEFSEDGGSIPHNYDMSYETNQ
jgi:hypothetical protein